ncbi:MAG: efflux RND transporter periplasmic adaptor subunit [Betaproteobacteria bacterium]
MRPEPAAGSGIRGGRAAGSAVLLIAAVALALAGGYWLGTRHAQAPGGPAAERAAAPAADDKGGRKILYYRNPMGLPDTSPTPKKDSMGMDYIPVYAGEEADGGSGIQVSTEKIQKLGVRVERAQRRRLDAVVRAGGRVEIDERRLHTVTAKYEGYIERLLVNATGQQVARGAVLFEAYSPDLLAAQREYALAAAGVQQTAQGEAGSRAAMQRLAEAALARLRNFDVTEEDIRRLAAGGEPRRTLSLRAPADGVVLEKKAVQGMRFMPGEVLYLIADLSQVWLIAEVFEQDIGRLRPGQRARIGFDAYPGQVFEGRVAAILPVLQADTRSVQVRIELANPGGRLKPAMFAQVELPVEGTAAEIVVPASAVNDSGRRQVVIVDKGAGRFEPREVRLGARGSDWVAVREGLAEGEAVVVAANFLLDAESNLKAALGAMTGGSNAGKASHSAVGTLDELDARTGQMVISHEPVPSLNWPRMTMEFVAANEAVARAVKPGEAIRFEFVERKPGEWVVTKMERRR